MKKIRLVGREAESAVLAQAWQAATSESARVVFLSGEPGIGKTRLATEFAEKAGEAGATVLAGHCDQDAILSYQPLAEAIREFVRSCTDDQLHALVEPFAVELSRLLPELAGRFSVGPLPAPLDPETERVRLFEAIAGLIHSICRVRPCLLVLDDLHWADKPTLILLRHLIQSCSRDALLLIGIYRDTDLSRSHPLAEVLADLWRGRDLERVALKGLSRSQLSDFIEEWSGAPAAQEFVEALHNETEGNPFFAEEVLEHLKEALPETEEDGFWPRAGGFGIPQSVREVIGRRLSRLSPAANRLLASAAVLGREFDFVVLARLVESDEEDLLSALDEALAAQLIVEQGRAGQPTYAFVHALVQQVLYEEQNLPRRQRLHLKAAAAIEGVYAHNPGAHVAALATHYRNAGVMADLDKAISYSERAAESALRVFAWEEATTHYEGALQALEYSPSNDPMRRCDLLIALGSALLPQGETRRVLDSIAPEALALAEGKDAQRATLACRLATIALSRIGSRVVTVTPEWQEWARAYDLYAPPGSIDRVWLDTELGWYYHMTGREAEAGATWRKAYALAQSLGSQDALFYSAALCISYAQAPEFEQDRLRIAREMRDLPLTGVSARTLSAFHLYVGWAAIDWGFRDEAEAAWDRLRVLSATFRDEFSRLYSIFAEGCQAILSGRFEDAIKLSEDEIAVGDEIGSALFGRMLAPLLSFRPLLYLGRTEDALERVSSDWRYAGVATEPANGKPRRLLVLIDAGRRAEALDLLNEIVSERHIGREEDGRTSTVDLLLLLEGAVALKQRELATILADRLRPLHGMTKAHCGVMTTVARHLGGAAALSDDSGLASSYFREAIAVAEAIGFRPEAALARFDLGKLLLKMGTGRAEALDLLRTARCEFEDMTMPAYVAQADDLLGGRPQAAAAPKYPDGLSLREVEVLRVLAAGKTNQQIADELVISVHTAAHHVGMILNKTQAANRTEAAAYARRMGLLDS